jgi:hypothetical protein
VATYNEKLVRKIVRLLESDQDGEVAAAARKLCSIAKEQGHNMDEMLAHIYGHGPEQQKYRTPTEAAWDDLGERMRKADDIRRDRERMNEWARKTSSAFYGFDPGGQDYTASNPFTAGFSGAQQAHAKPKQPYTNKLLVELEKLAYGIDSAVGLLTAWEVNFTEDILSKGFSRETTDTQNSVIREILAKLQGRERSPEEEAFWKS